MQPPARERPTQFSLRSLVLAAATVPPIIGALVYLIREFPHELEFLLALVLMIAGICVIMIGMLAATFVVMFTLTQVFYVLPVELTFRLIDHFQRGSTTRDRQPPSPSTPR